MSTDINRLGLTRVPSELHARRVASRDQRAINPSALLKGPRFNATGQMAFPLAFLSGAGVESALRAAFGEPESELGVGGSLLSRFVFETPSLYVWACCPASSGPVKWAIAEKGAGVDGSAGGCGSSSGFWDQAGADPAMLGELLDFFERLAIALAQCDPGMRKALAGSVPGVLVWEERWALESSLPRLRSSAGPWAL